MCVFDFVNAHFPTQNRRINVGQEKNLLEILQAKHRFFCFKYKNIGLAKAKQNHVLSSKFSVIQTDETQP